VTSQGQRETKDRDDFEDLLRERAYVFRQMSMLLETRRLESQKGPFRGFQSPPGRF